MTSHTGDLHDFLIQRETERHPCPVWVIYHKPLDFPGSLFAIRRYLMAWPYVDMIPTPLAAPCESLLRARKVIGKASDQKAVMFKREPTDDPVIVEAWLGESLGPGGDG